MLTKLRHVAVAAGLFVGTILGSVAASTTPASAYAIESAYWYYDANDSPCGQQSGPLWNPCTLGIYLDSSVTSRGTGWTGSILAAGNDWYTWDSSRSRLDWEYFSDPSGSTSSHETVYAGDLGQCNPGGTCTVGQSNIYSLPGYIFYNQIFYATVTINDNSSINWGYSSGSCCTSTQLCMECVTGHEFGHGLGLDHPVQGPNSGIVMECIISMGEVVTPSTDDHNGVYHYYSGHPNDFPPPGSKPC